MTRTRFARKASALFGTHPSAQTVYYTVCFRKPCGFLLPFRISFIACAIKTKSTVLKSTVLFILVTRTRFARKASALFGTHPSVQTVYYTVCFRKPYGFLLPFRISFIAYAIKTKSTVLKSTVLFILVTRTRFELVLPP